MQQNPIRKVPIIRAGLAAAVVLALATTFAVTKLHHKHVLPPVTPVTVEQVVKPPEPPAPVVAPARVPAPKAKAPAAKHKPAQTKVQPRKA